MILIAIDPGNKRSAYVEYDTEAKLPREHAILENDAMLFHLQHECLADRLVLEQVAAMGQCVGKEVFETVFWSGRFCQAWLEAHNVQFDRLPRHKVKMHLCGTTRAKDSNIRQAILDLYYDHPDCGAGKLPQVGVKSDRGPLYGISKDIWQALALAITFSETAINGSGVAS